MMQNIDINLRPAVSFAVLQVSPLILLSLAFLLLAWTISPFFILFSLLVLLVTWYRMLLIRSHRYLITADYLRFSCGLLFRRTEQLELYSIKDYILTQSLPLQILRLSNLTLKSTGPENSVLTMKGIPGATIIECLRTRVQAARLANPVYEII
jgi:uncharacterized membrane protein YdbT with pleckstrin-like domain